MDTGLKSVLFAALAPRATLGKNGPIRSAMIALAISACMLHPAGPSIAGPATPDASFQMQSHPSQTMLRMAQAKRSANLNTVGIVTGPPSATDFLIAREISMVLASGQETGPRGEVALRILPIVGKGGVQSIRDVLTLPGADMGIAPTILLNRLRASKAVGDISKSLVYVAPLFPEEIHILARQEIRTVADLNGRRVNLGEDDGGTATLVREILNRLGVKAAEINVDQVAAAEGMRNGDIAATVFITGKPARWLERYGGRDGLHLVPLASTTDFENDYVPATFVHQDYPNLIAADERIPTLAVGSVLFANNAPKGSERYRRLETFVDAFFSRIAEFHGAALHPKWSDINVAADVPGWNRFAPAERWLKQRRLGASEADARVEFERYLDQTGSAPSAAERERLFQNFLRWREGIRNR